MARYYSAVFFALMPLLARAAPEDAAPPPPPADVSPWGLIIFSIIFVGMVVGFGIFIWHKERTRKHKDTQ